MDGDTKGELYVSLRDINRKMSVYHARITKNLIFVVDTSDRIFPLVVGASLKDLSRRSNGIGQSEVDTLLKHDCKGGTSVFPN